MSERFTLFRFNIGRLTILPRYFRYIIGLTSSLMKVIGSLIVKPRVLENILWNHLETPSTRFHELCMESQTATSARPSFWILYMWKLPLCAKPAVLLYAWWSHQGILLYSCLGNGTNPSYLNEISLILLVGWI